jgi:general secretion pathway protein G
MKTYSTRKSGFTLVEILIVVIILGILAAIVIPQFTNASQDARKNSLTSQLQTIRSQLELAKLQHRDNPSPKLVAGGATAWDELTVKTDDTYLAAGEFGPYLNAAPANPLNGNTKVEKNTDAAEPTFGGTGGADATVGWVYHEPTGKIFATTKSGTKIYNEATGDNSED